MIHPNIQIAASQAARLLWRGEIGVFEAEHSVIQICNIWQCVEYDEALDMLHKRISSYESEMLRICAAIRIKTRAMLDARKPPDAIKSKAAITNKHGLLSASEVQEIMKSEYQAWKSQQTFTNPVGNLTTSTAPTANRQTMMSPLQSAI